MVGLTKKSNFKMQIFQIFKKMKIIFFFQKSKFLKIDTTRQYKWSFRSQNIPNHQKTHFEPILRGAVPKSVFLSDSYRMWLLKVKLDLLTKQGEGGLGGLGVKN